MIFVPKNAQSVAGGWLAHGRECTALCDRRWFTHSVAGALAIVHPLGFDPPKDGDNVWMSTPYKPGSFPVEHRAGDAPLILGDSGGRAGTRFD